MLNHATKFFVLAIAILGVAACAGTVQPDMGYGWQTGVVIEVQDEQPESRFAYSRELHTVQHDGHHLGEGQGTDANVGARYGRDVNTTQPVTPEALGSQGFNVFVRLRNGETVVVTQRYYPGERFRVGQDVKVFKHGENLAATAY